MGPKRYRRHEMPRRQSRDDHLPEVLSVQAPSRTGGEAGVIMQTDIT